jgi:hypothetical protein
MDQFVTNQICSPSGKVRSSAKTFFVSVAVFEENGKTILQPMLSEKEATFFPDMFQNKTLEIWLSNGNSDLTLFDVNILKYEQVLQSLTRCDQVENQLCLKNLVDGITSCEQCPLSKETEES